MKLLILTKYAARGPSSRYRFLQYLPFLTKSGWSIRVSPFFDDTYVRALFEGRKVSATYLLLRFINRAWRMLWARRFDVVWIEGETLPYMPAAVESLFLLCLPQRRFHDFDDAIWLRYRERIWLRNKFRTTLRRAHGITAGNAYLAEYCRHIQPNVAMIPTCVDGAKYASLKPKLDGHRIGWIGTPNTLFYLQSLDPVFRQLSLSRSFTLVIIGAEWQADGYQIECIPWSQHEETNLIAALDIGIMPLEDDQWSRGKCGLKLVQYLAAGVPAVASPVGVNQSILTDSEGGFAAEDHTQWVDGLDQLLASPPLRQSMGARGKAWVHQNMTIEVMSPRIHSFLSGSPSD